MGVGGEGGKKKREPGTAGVIRRKQTNRTRRAQVSTGGLEDKHLKDRIDGREAADADTHRTLGPF